MTQYELDFSNRLIDAASAIKEKGITDFEAARTVTYLSQLASEIALKAILEQVGIPAKQILKRSHDLSGLLSDVGKCQVYVEITPTVYRWVPASRLRGVTVDARYNNATVGTILTAEETGASKYPNHIRYGSSFNSYPPELWLGAAEHVVKWARKHWDYIKK